MNPTFEWDLPLVERLRNRLQPRGTENLVQLTWTSNFGMVKYDLIAECLDELDRMPLRTELGTPPTALERLAYQLLLDSAFIDLAHEAGQRKFIQEQQNENRI